MKKFVFGLICLISLTFTTQTQAISIDYETPNITITDHFDLSVVQIAEDITFQIGNDQDNQRYHLFEITGSRYVTSIASSGHSQNFTINKGVDISTNFNKEQPSYSEFAQSWRPDRSIVYLRRIEASSTDLQRDGNYTKGNYYRTKGNYNHFAKPNECLTTTILLDRNWSSSGILKPYRLSINKAKTVTTNSIPVVWFRSISKA